MRVCVACRGFAPHRLGNWSLSVSCRLVSGACGSARPFVTSTGDMYQPGAFIKSWSNEVHSTLPLPPPCLVCVLGWRNAPKPALEKDLGPSPVRIEPRSARTDDIEMIRQPVLDHVDTSLERVGGCGCRI